MVQNKLSRFGSFPGRSRRRGSVFAG